MLPVGLINAPWPNDRFRPCEGTNPVDWLSIISTDASGELGATGLVGFECECGVYKAGIDRVRE